MGPQRDAAAAASRPALRQCISLRCDLPRPRQRRSLGAPEGGYRGDATAYQRNLAPRRVQCPCRPADGSRSLAHNRRAPGARQYHADLPALTVAGTEPAGEHLAVPTFQLAIKPRLRQLRGYRHGLLRGMEQTRRYSGRHQIHRNAAMGACRSMQMTVGIIWFDALTIEQCSKHMIRSDRSRVGGTRGCGLTGSQPVFIGTRHPEDAPDHSERLPPVSVAQATFAKAIERSHSSYHRVNAASNGDV